MPLGTIFCIENAIRKIFSNGCEIQGMSFLAGWKEWIVGSDETIH